MERCSKHRTVADTSPAPLRERCRWGDFPARAAYNPGLLKN